MEFLKVALGSVAGILIFVAAVVLPATFLWGGLFLAGAALPFFAAATAAQCLITTVVMVPLAFFPGTRHLAGRGIRFLSYMFGLTVWLWGLMVTYQFWGFIPVFIGLFILGVGVVPMGIIAYGFEGMWLPMLQLGGGVIMVFATRIVGFWLIQKAEDDQLLFELSNDVN